MSRSTDPGHFFQTSSALETTQRKSAKSKNKNGNPIVLPSKILAVIPDDTPGGDGCIFIAESAGTARRVDVRAGGGVSSRGVDLKDSATLPAPKPTRKIYRGPTAPLTSVAISPDATTLFGGCWDKSIWSWDIETGQAKRRYVGHSDFVKSVVCFALGSAAGALVHVDGGEDVSKSTSPVQSSTLDLLISGSADSSIIIWAIATGQKLHTIRGGERASGILDLAVDPSSLVYPRASHTSPQHQHQRQRQIPTGFTLFAASSDPTIRRWRISAPIPTARTTSSISTVIIEAEPDINVHETSVNKLVFVAVPDDDEDDSDADAEEATGVADEEQEEEEAEDEPHTHLFTASSDTTAKHLTRRWRRSRGRLSASLNDTSAPLFTAKTAFPHPDFVRAVAVAIAVSTAQHGTQTQTQTQTYLLATACRDEEIRLFDLDTGELVRKLSGHFEEVTGLAVVRGGAHTGAYTGAHTGAYTDAHAHDVLVSVGIDGTVRWWGLELEGDAGASYGDGGVRVDDYDNDHDNGIGESVGVDADGRAAGDGLVPGKASLVTAEEEAELAALMDSDEEGS